MAKIDCCKDCPARRLRCHGWGECVHYMTRRAMLDDINDERQRKWRGAYTEADSANVNRIKKRLKTKK